MTEIADRNEIAGWMVDASVHGGSVQRFYVYELNNKKAAAMARTAVAATDGDWVDTVKLLTIDDLEGHGLKPGEVKQII
jgi:hypothetical protein